MESRFFTMADGAQLHAEIVGQGYPLLCISGFACSNYNFFDLKNDLKDQFQLVMVDNRGTGKSPAISDTYSLRDMAKDAIEVMRQLGHKKFAVAGISMGGYISQYLAFEAPKEVSALVLICTSGGGPDFVRPNAMPEKDLIAFNKLDVKERNRIFIDHFVHPIVKQQDPQRFKEISDLRERNQESLDTVIYHNRAIQDFLAETLPLETIEIPTLVLAGADDRLINPVNSGLLANRIKNAKLHIIKEANHLVYFEKHQELADYIKPFLAAKV
jgi:pimeloyl-ACP methyl ester carboxylesterase